MATLQYYQQNSANLTPQQQQLQANATTSTSTTTATITATAAGGLEQYFENKVLFHIIRSLEKVLFKIIEMPDVNLIIFYLVKNTHAE